MDILGLSALQFVVLTGLVSGGTELVKKLFKKEWVAAATIITAAIIGALGSLGMGVNPLVGTVAGLATSGYITIAQNIGKKTK